jgi:hypothetical protein
MKIGDYVRLAIDMFERDDQEAAVLFACLAVDGTARKAMQRRRSSRAGFENFLRERYWLLEPMATPGINLVETRWTNVPVEDEPAPDFAALIYRVFRCSLGHGEDLPTGFKLTPSAGTPTSSLLIAKDVLHLPDRLPFALLATAVLCPANRAETTSEGYYLTLDREEFVINEWWGREEDFRPIAARYNTTRVKLEGL